MAATTLRRSALLVAVAAALPAGAATPAPVRPPVSVHLAVLSRPAAGGAADQAVLDAGRLSAAGTGRTGAILLRERVAVRLDGIGRMARLSVALADDLPGVEVRVDGQPVTLQPRMVDPARRLGLTVVHAVDITIPRDVPAGPFLGQLRWIADTD